MTKTEETKKGLFDWYFKPSLLIRIFVALIIGAAIGIFIAGRSTPEIMTTLNTYVKPFGDLFIRLLMMIIVPTIAFTLITGSSSIAPSKIGRMGVKILAFYMIVSVIAAIIGLIMAIIFKPGMGMDLSGLAAGGEKVAAKIPISQILLDIVPTNPFAAFVSGAVLPIIFFCLLMGLSLAHVRDSKDERIKNAGDAVFNFFDGMAEIMYKVVGGVMQYAPIGVFAIMITVFAANGSKVVGPLIKVTAVCYIGYIVHYFVTYGTFLTLNGFNYFKFIKKARAPFVTAFVTRSSGGTLPITMINADNMGVSKEVYSFTLPIGATISMDGTALYQAVCACFIANAVGVPLSISQMVMVVAIAVLASLGTAGVPGAGGIMLLMVLQGIGLNVAAGSQVAAVYAMILGIDALLDMGRTGLNVAVDVVGTLWMGKSEGQLDYEKYEAYDGKM